MDGLWGLMVQALPPALASVMTLAPPSGPDPWILLGFTNVKGSLPETNSEFTPENRQATKRKQSYSNHPFAGAMLVSGRVVGSI